MSKQIGCAFTAMLTFLSVILFTADAFADSAANQSPPEICETYTATDVPIYIDEDGTPTITSSILITAEGHVNDINILNLMGTHTWEGDLNFSLTSPSGTTIYLFGNICGESDDFNINLDDDAPLDVPCPYNDGNTYYPEDPLATFNGESITGTWTLTIFDDGNEDGGYLDNWSLDICYTPLYDYTLLPAAGDLHLCQGGEAMTEILIGADYEGPVALNYSNLPVGVQITLSPNPALPGNYVSLQVNADPNITGHFDIPITGNDGLHFQTITMGIHVYDSPDAIAPITPSDGQSGLSPDVFFDWQDDDNAQFYTLVVATDIAFNNVVYFENTISESEQLMTLSGNEQYFWRIRSSNPCGTGNWSDIQTFSTVNVVCHLYPSADIPYVISDGPPPIEIFSKVHIPSGGSIIDINVVNMTGTHTYLGDLKCSLISPSGTSAVLVDRVCGSEADFNINFDDDSNYYPPCPYNDGENYLSEQPLAVFNGEPAVGDWILKIEDLGNIDGGFLQSWGLQVCMSDYEDYSLIATPEIVKVCGTGQETLINLSIGQDFSGPVSLSIANVPVGLLVSLTENMGMPDGQVEISITNLSASPGNYSFDIIGDDGIHTTTTQVVVKLIILPDVITLAAPPDNSSEIELQPFFIWASIPFAQGYHFQLATDPELNNIIEDVFLLGPTFQVQNELVINSTYYWQVTTENLCGATGTDVLQFSTHGDLSLSTASDTIFGCSGEITMFDLMVGAGFVDEGAYLSAELPDGAAFFSTPNPVPGGNTCQVGISGLSAGLHDLLITATSGFLTNNISLVLNIAEGPDTAPQLISPENGETGISLTPYFSWSIVPDAASYTFVLSLDPELNNNIYAGTVAGNSFFYENELQTNTTYYWGVRSDNICPGSESPVFSFQTQFVSTVSVSEPTFQITPNPAINNVHISWNANGTGITKLKLMSAEGRSLMEMEIPDSKSETDLTISDYASGTYWVHLINDSGISSGKLIIIK